MVDSTGNVVAKYKYDLWGVQTKESGSKDAEFGYGGYYVHRPSGLYLTWYRQYDPSIARWLSRDPIGEQGGLNLYAYVGNDSVGYVDPHGLQQQDLRDWQEGKPGKGYEDDIGGRIVKECIKECFISQYGDTFLLPAILGGGLIGVGLPIRNKRFVTKGSSEGTSLASEFFRKHFGNKRFKCNGKDFRLPAPTSINLLSKTSKVGTFLGRWTPILGWGALAIDGAAMASCIDNCAYQKIGECCEK